MEVHVKIITGALLVYVLTKRVNVVKPLIVLYLQIKYVVAKLKHVFINKNRMDSHALSIMHVPLECAQMDCAMVI
jgi:hypothetical protein